MTIEVKPNEFEAIIVSAFRYAIGRQTYIPSIVAGFITPLLPELSDDCLTVICKGIEDKRMSEGRNPLGHPQIDAPIWNNLYDDIMAERATRILAKPRKKNGNT